MENREALREASADTTFQLSFEKTGSFVAWILTRLHKFDFPTNAKARENHK
jgi:hypothetical protein